MSQGFIILGPGSSGIVKDFFLKNRLISPMGLLVTRLLLVINTFIVF